METTEVSAHGRPQKVVITAACVLHNFLVREEGHQMEDCENVGGNDGNECQAVDTENTTGQKKGMNLLCFWFRVI